MGRDYRDLALPERSADVDIVLNRLEICKEPMDERNAVSSIVQTIDRETREGVILTSHFGNRFLQSLTLSRPDLTSMLWHFGHDARDWLRDMPDIRVDPHRVQARNSYGLFGCIMIAKHLTFAPGYDDVETLSIIRFQRDRYLVLIGDDSIEWYLQLEGLYPYSPGASLPDETNVLDPAALEACLGLWVTFFRRHGGNRSDMARLLEMLTMYHREHPATPGQMRDLAKMRENLARFGTLQEAQASNSLPTIEHVETLAIPEESRSFSQPPQESRTKVQVAISPQSTLADLKRLIEMDPTRISLYLKRAELYARQSQYDLAVADYTHVLTRQPNNTTALFNRGKIYVDTGQLAQAVEDYQALIRVNPTLAEAYHNRGLARSRLGKLQAARQDFDQAIALKPNYAAAYHNRGILYVQLADYDAAIGDFDQAVRLDPSNARLHYDRALAYGSTFDYETALAGYLRAIRLDPTLDRPYYNVGMVLVKLNRFDEALPYLRKALQVGDRKARRVIDWITSIQHETEGTSFVVNLADSYEEIEVLSKYHPLMTSPDFIRILRRAMESNPMADTRKSRQRLAWLQQLGDRPPTGLQPSTPSLEPSPKSGEQSVAPGDSRYADVRTIWLIVGLVVGLIVAAIWARAGVTAWAVVGAAWGGLAGASYKDYRASQSRPEALETAGGFGGGAGGCGLIFGWLGLLIMTAIPRISVPEMPGRITTSLVVGSIGGTMGGMIVGTVIDRVGLLLIGFATFALAKQAPPSIKRARGILRVFVWLYAAMIAGMFAGLPFGLLYGLVFRVQGVFGDGLVAGGVAGGTAGATVGLIAGIVLSFRAQDSVKTRLCDAGFGAFGGLVGGTIFEYIYRNFPS